MKTLCCDAKRSKFGVKIKQSSIVHWCIHTYHKVLIWKGSLWPVLSIDSVLQSVLQEYRSCILLWFFFLSHSICSSAKFYPWSSLVFLHASHFVSSSCFTVVPICILLSYVVRVWLCWGCWSFCLFIYLASKECQWLSSVAALEATREDEGSSLLWSQKATGFIHYSVPHFHICWLQNSSSVCQLLLPRLKRENIWHLQYFPNHIIDVTQSPLNSVPTESTGPQGTWQGVHTQQQMLCMYPLHTQPHFCPPLPRMGRLCRPCCFLKLWVDIQW